MDASESVPKKAMGTLNNCLVGSWKTSSNSFPTVKEVEAWARGAWRLKGKVLVAYMNNDLLLLEFTYLEEAKWVLESDRRTFMGGSLHLEWWSPKSGCAKKKEMVKEAWVRVVGLRLHLWTQEVFRMVGDSCGGFVALDKETTLRTKVSWAKILVKVVGMRKPSSVNILEGSRSFELQLWWELPPWYSEVILVKGNFGFEKPHPEVEDEGPTCAA